jgi:hypothetical protein
MKTLHYNITINAPAEQVWKALWEDANYRKWTSAFTEGSHAISDWKEGSRIQFLGPDGNGMFSEISKLVPNEYMAFRHLGVIKDGVEQPANDETKGWEGAMETYTLKQHGDVTEVNVSVDTLEEYESHFTDSFPKSLQILKQIAEQSAGARGN